MNNNEIEKVHMFLISLALVLTPFTGISGISFLGSMGKIASIYPLLVGVILWMGQRRGVVPIPRYNNFYSLLLFYMIAVLSICINLDEIQYYHFQGQSGIQRAVVQIISLGFCVLVPVYVYDIFKNYKGNVYEFLFRYLEYSFYIAGMYSFFEILSFFNIGDVGGYLAFFDSLFRDGESNGNILRIRSVTLEPSTLGEYAAVLLPLLIFKAGNKKIYFFSALYLLLLCILSVSRTAYIVLILQFLLCYVLSGKKQKKIIGLLAVVIFFIGSIIYSQAVEQFGEKTFDAVVMSTINSDGTDFEWSNIARYGSQEAAFIMFKDSPIYGVGYGMYGFLAPDYYPQYAWISNEIVSRAINSPNNGAWPPVHNLIARIMGETGGVGLFAWLLMMIFTVRYMYRCLIYGKNSGDMYAASALISLIGCFVMEFKTDSIYVLPVYIIIGMSMVVVRNCKTGENCESDK